MSYGYMVIVNMIMRITDIPDDTKNTNEDAVEQEIQSILCLPHGVNELLANQQAAIHTEEGLS